MCSRSHLRIVTIFVLLIMLIPTGILRAENQETYIMLCFQCGVEGWQHIYNGAVDAAKQIGSNINVILQGPQAWSGPEQALIMDQLITMRPDGFMVSPADTMALVTSINRAMKAGIPVITFDSDAPTSDRLTFVGIDNYQSGITAGRAIGNLVKNGLIAITHVIGPYHVTQRLEGIKKVLAEEFPEIRIVQVVDDKAQAHLAANIAASLLQANPDLKGIFCTHGQGTPGIVAGIRQAGKRPGKDVLVAGWDYSKETLQLIEKGEVNFSIAQAQYSMGYWAFMNVYAYSQQVSNKLSSGKKRKGPLLPLKVDIQDVIVTKDNVKDWK